MNRINLFILEITLKFTNFDFVIFFKKKRFELKYVNPDKYINWTLEDDIKLLESYREYGAQWSKIAKEVFPTRNNHSCLFRFNKLMHWKRQNVWFDNQSEEIKEFILFIFKKKRKTIDRNGQVFTSHGDIVPKIPKFGSGLNNLGNIINQIYEKRTLIDEFINKKRQGQLSLTLLVNLFLKNLKINDSTAENYYFFKLTLITGKNVFFSYILKHFHKL